MKSLRRAGPAGFALLLAIALAACSAASPPTGSASPSSPASPSGSAAPPSGSSDPSPGGSSDTGALPPDTPIAGGGGGGQPADPGGQPQLVLPRQPTVQPHPIAITKLLSQVEGRHVVLNAQWWSGVEPCTLLDRVQVDRDGNTFTITVIEGLNPAEVACIDLAVLKATVIDLGELEPGTYTVRASTGDAEPITVVVE